MVGKPYDMARVRVFKRLALGVFPFLNIENR